MWSETNATASTPEVASETPSLSNRGVSNNITNVQSAVASAEDDVEIVPQDASEMRQDMTNTDGDGIQHVSGRGGAGNAARGNHVGRKRAKRELQMEKMSELC